MSNADEFIQQLGVDLGCPALRLQDGFCELKFDNDIELAIELDDSQEFVNLHSVIGTGQENIQQEQVLELLLRAQDGGIMFALDENRGDLVLCDRCYIGSIDYAAFAQSIKRFRLRVAEVRDAWSRLMAIVEESTPTVQPQSTPSLRV